MVSRRSQARARLLTCVSVSAVAIATSQGCAQELPGDLSSLDSATVSSGAGGEGSGQNLGAEKFEAIEPELVSQCGTCHDVGGLADTPFLAGPDRHHAMISWPGVVEKDPNQSVLLTHARMSGGHSGTNLDSPALKDTLLPKVQQWLAEESKGIANPSADAGLFITPFSPILGFNAVYLDPLGSQFHGMALTFNADELTVHALALSDVELHTTTKKGLHVVHPIFVVQSLSGTDPDPVDSFSNVDEIVPLGETRALGPGTVVLTNWKKDARLSLAFEKIQAIEPAPADAGAGGAGPSSGCKDVTAFTNDAAPKLKSNCFGCHGGNNAQAQAAVDMSELDGDSAEACAQIKNRISVDAPMKSQLFVTTDPNGNAAHPYKFGGSSTKFGDFRTAVSSWISTEK